MENILWVCLGITVWIAVAAAFLFWPAVSAWRLHRRTGEKLQAERESAGRAADYRYDPKQFRRRQ